MLEVERNSEVVETLGDVAGKPRGLRHDFNDRLYLDPAPAEPPRHDQADVAGADDHRAGAGKRSIPVQQLLRASGGIDSRRTGAGDRKVAASAFPAAHRENHRAGGVTDHAPLRRQRDQPEPVVRQAFYIGYGAAECKDRAGFFGDPGDAGRILRPGQLLLEIIDAEAVVNALPQDAAGQFLAVDHHGGTSGPGGLGGGGKSGGSGADHRDVVCFFLNHSKLPPVITVRAGRRGSRR